MSQNSKIIFVCEHGAAKSVIAAAYFNKSASEANLDIHAVARGTHPDQELSSKTIAGLHKDGLDPGESVPRKLSVADVESAQRIVAFCELPEESHANVGVERWDDIPPVSENYEKARDAIVEKISQLIRTI